ncbi:MAG: glycosyltransferase [Deltaproteobacteria bacterium]|nr:glycosyltransferase [Deltaproteobacteria bacterium]
MRADAAALPFGAGSFDAVIVAEVLEHVRAPDAVLREVHRGVAGCRGAGDGAVFLQGPRRTRGSLALHRGRAALLGARRRLRDRADPRGGRRGRGGGGSRGAKRRDAAGCGADGARASPAGARDRAVRWRARPLVLGGLPARVPRRASRRARPRDPPRRDVVADALPVGPRLADGEGLRVLRPEARGAVMRTIASLLLHRPRPRSAAANPWPAPILLLAYTSQLGGAERSLLEATARLDRRLFTPILAVPNEGPLAVAARERGIELFLDGTPHLERLGPVAWLGVVDRLAALVMERGVRLIHAGTVWRLTRAAAVAVLTRVPAIGHVRDEDLRLFRSLRFRLAASRMQRLIAISASVMHELVAAGQHPLRVPVLWNGLDPEPYERASGGAALRAEWGVAPEAPLVGVVGNVEPRKGQVDFVLAAAHVALARPDARFVIVGSDLHGVWREYGDELARAIAERGLGERIVLAAAARTCPT